MTKTTQGFIIAACSVVVAGGAWLGVLRPLLMPTTAEQDLKICMKVAAKELFEKKGKAVPPKSKLRYGCESGVYFGRRIGVGQ